MLPITIRSIELHPVILPYVEPLRTSFGVDLEKTAILVEVTTTEGITGWGEVSVERNPGYGSETITTALHILREFCIPLMVGQTVSHPTDTPSLLRSVRGHNHTKAGLESAIWDAFSRHNNMRFADLLAFYLPNGHIPRDRATVGVSIGIQSSVEATLDIINKRLAQGYQRIKLKIEPSWDVELARGVREALPDITLMLDANSAYTLADRDHLMELDEFNLLMIEQPLSYDDIYEHSKLQPHLKTAICLDESVKSANDLRLALEMGACRILNLKPVRVGGYTESLEVYKVCVENNIPLWIGGMLETGVGRAANLAFASLPGVTLPSDISATDRYFKQDIAEPAFTLNPDSTISVPQALGIGVEVIKERFVYMS